MEKRRAKFEIKHFEAVWKDCSLFHIQSPFMQSFFWESKQEGYVYLKDLSGKDSIDNDPCLEQSASINRISVKYSSVTWSCHTISESFEFVNFRTIIDKKKKDEILKRKRLSIVWKRYEYVFIEMRRTKCLNIQRIDTEIFHWNPWTWQGYERKRDGETACLVAPTHRLQLTHLRIVRLSARPKLD